VTAGWDTDDEEGVEDIDEVPEWPDADSE